VSLFSCQVDIFNLSNPFPSGNWKDDYSNNKKVFNNFFFTLLLIVMAMVPTILQCKILLFFDYFGIINLQVLLGKRSDPIR